MVKESCLVEQPFIKNPDKAVSQYVKEHNAEVVKFAL